MRIAALCLAFIAVCACGNGPDNGRHVDWFLWQGVGYQAPFGDSGRELADADLAAPQFTIRAQVTRSSVALKSGEAGVLPAGTQVFAVRGYAPTFRLAARVDGLVRLYEVLPHQGLRRGADLLDVEDRVRAIEFGPGGNALFTRVERPDRIARLVHLISVAPIDLSPPWGAPAGPKESVAITLELIDGTRTTRALDRNRGRFADVLNTGDEFERLVEEILSSQWCAPHMLTGC